jgi:hypothetical protein
LGEISFLLLDKGSFRFFGVLQGEEVYVNFSDKDLEEAA